MKLLVSGCNKGGGLYLVDVANKAVKKIKENIDFRGMTKYNDHFIVLSDNLGILMLDKHFNIVKRNPKIGLGYHGCTIYRNKLYVVETARNTIGIYNLSSLVRIGGIRFANANHDVLHINDIDIAGARLFVSMFNHYKGKNVDKAPKSWLETAKKGTILEYSLINNRIIKIHYNKLSHPHTVTCHEGEIYYCNSFELEVRKGDKRIFKTEKYPRGLAFGKDTIYVGQSLSRNRPDISHGRAGIIIIDTLRNKSENIPLPCNEVYSILTVN